MDCICETRRIGTWWSSWIAYYFKNQLRRIDRRGVWCMAWVDLHSGITQSWYIVQAPLGSSTLFNFVFHLGLPSLLTGKNYPQHSKLPISAWVRCTLWRWILEIRHRWYYISINAKHSQSCSALKVLWRSPCRTRTEFAWKECRSDLHTVFTFYQSMNIREYMRVTYKMNKWS